MDYSKMSDFEINKAVGEIALDRRWACKPGHSGNETESWYYGSADSFADPLPLLPDFCNLWADAGPIIQLNRIMLNPYCADELWKAEHPVSDDGFMKTYAVSYDKNPLRAAMIVYLMMHDKGEE